MATIPPSALTPDHIAEATVQKWINRWQAAARAVIEDMRPDEVAEADEDAILNRLSDYSDSGTVSVAQEAINMAFRAGRAAGLSMAATALGQKGDTAAWRRSSVMEDNTCGTCAALDGTRISGPNADLGKEHEGPPETCLCLPYLDLEE